MQTDWEQHYLDGHTPWDKGSAAPPLIQWLTENPGQITGQVLVPGCGQGHDARAIAALEKSASVIGVDISPKAIELANAFDCEANEIFSQDDLFTMPKKYSEHFDWVWEHTCFCAIDPANRDDYVSSVYKILKPGANLLAVFYLNPYDNHHEPGGGPPHGTSVEELKDRFTQKGQFKIEAEYIPSAAYPGREGLEYMIQFSK